MYLVSFWFSSVIKCFCKCKHTISLALFAGHHLGFCLSVLILSSCGVISCHHWQYKYGLSSGNPANFELQASLSLHRARLIKKKHCFVHLHSMYRQMLKSTCKNSSQLTHGCTLVYGIVMIQPEIYFWILLSKVYRLLIQHSISQTWKQLANHKEV